MRYVFFTALIFFAVLSCTTESDQNRLSPEEVGTLRDELSLLKSENLKKDSLITESITYFNEIERNLSTIEKKEKEIRLQFRELDGSKKGSKEIILEKIRYINTLRLENGRKMYALQQKLDTINVAENEFKEILKRLQVEIRQKDKEMSLLQDMLVQKDQQYARLFADYQRQIEKNKEQELKSIDIAKDLNTVYYVAGTQKELKANNIISVRKKGLASRKIALSDELEERQFTTVQMDDTKEIALEGKKVTLVTDHPQASYQLITEGGNSRLKILDPHAFWKFSRYLVVVVD